MKIIGMKPYIHKINYYETDKMGITHHSNYIRFMEEARIDFMEQIGLGYDKMEEMGIGSPVINVECNYRKTTTFPDVISIIVKTEKVSAFKLFLTYEMKVNDQVVSTGKSSHCFLDKTGKPVMLEKEFPTFYKALMDNSVEQQG